MYKDKVDFVQVVKLKNSVNTSVAGTITFQACTDEMCSAASNHSFTVDVK